MLQLQDSPKITVSDNTAHSWHLLLRKVLPSMFVVAQWDYVTVGSS